MKKAGSRWGVLLQTRAMDRYFRVHFGVPEVRAALVGTDYLPSLGMCEVDDNHQISPIQFMHAHNHDTMDQPKHYADGRQINGGIS